MERRMKGIFALAALAMAAALLAWCAIGAPVRAAFADEEELSQLQQRVESSANDYNAALARLDELNGQIEQNQAKIEQINAQLPTQQESAGDAMKVLYMVQQDGDQFIELVLGAQDFGDFLDKIEYLDRLHAHNTAQFQRLVIMKQELQDAQERLADSLQQAQVEADRASRALEQAKAARQEAEEKAAAIAAQQAAEAAARAQAEAEAAARAQEEEQQAQEAPSGVDGENPELSFEVDSEPGDVDGSVAQGDVDWSADKQVFVDEWAARIDGYLSGTPLAGQGATFAEAAWNYGVDPRWSPAISCIESSCGAYCFRPHNAWGWGSSSWGSWEEAIDAHVSGLARVYGSTLTLEAAQMYCPPSYTSWYNNVLSEMNSI